MGVVSCGQRVMKTLIRYAFTVQEWHILHHGGLRCSSSLSQRMCPTLSSLSLQSHLLAPCCWYQAIVQSGLLLLVPGCHTEWVAVAGTRLSLIQSGLLLLVPGYHTEWVAVAGMRLSYRVGCYCWYKSVIHNNLLLLFVLGYPYQVGLLLVLLGCPYRAVCLVAGGGTQLSFRGCWLAYGCTQLSFRGCWLAGGGTQLSFRGCWLACDCTQLSFRCCWLAGGGTQLSFRGCLVAGGGTRLYRDGADGRVATAGLWR